MPMAAAIGDENH